jgi:ElaB/YqjD/DUF883 family membrane-anchored ribosome-binding protein
MKIFLLVIAVFTFCTVGHAQDGEQTIQNLRNEIAQLKANLAKLQDQSVTNFSTAVELRAKYEAAIQRINEANDVARQWRSKSVGLQRELAYTKAIAAGTTTVDLEKVYAAAKTPHFRIANIPARAESVVRDDGVSPNLLSLR